MTAIRKALADLRLEEALDNSNIVSTALAYFNRQEDHEQIRTAIKKRFGTSVKTVKNPGKDTGVLETYVRGEFETKVDKGMVENFSVGFAPKVVGALATLFTEKNQKFTLNHETVENVESAEYLLYEQNRAQSNFKSLIVEADKMSVQVGSCALLVEFSKGKLSYRKFSPGDVTAYYNDYLEEEDNLRAVDRSVLEDATAVVIKLGTNDNLVWNYLAIFGGSDEYINGRYVQFQGDEKLTRIPGLGEKGVIDHEIDGEIANPLTWWANQPENKDKDLPEYPVIVIKGGMTEDGSALPVYMSLYEAALEFDISASHTESSGQKAAAGTRVYKKSSDAKGLPIPRSLSGDIVAEDGCEVVAVSHDSGSVKVGTETTERHMLHTASGYGVPDYMVISQDHTLDASSGVALAVKTEPLMSQRDYRIDLNRPSVNKLFEVERAYIAIHAPNESEIKEADINLLLECTQTWDPGEKKLPENKNELATRLVTAKEKGLIDEIEAIRQFNDLASDEEAIAFYEKMQERTKKYPPLSVEEQPKPQLGLKNRQPTSGI